MIWIFIDVAVISLYESRSLIYSCKMLLGNIVRFIRVHNMSDL